MINLSVLGVVRNIRFSENSGVNTPGLSYFGQLAIHVSILVKNPGLLTHNSYMFIIIIPSNV